MEIDDDIDLYQMKDDNNFLVTNRLCYPEYKNEEVREDKQDVPDLNLKSVQFLEFVNNPKYKTNNIKEALISNLKDSFSRITNLIQMIDYATMERNQLELKSENETNYPESESKSKIKLQRTNFLKKLDHFSQTIKSFKASLETQRVNCRKSQEIFQELFQLKKLGFKVDNNFEFRSNLSLKNISITLHNQYILNFQNFFNTNKHAFTLQVKEEEPEIREYSLQSDFYTRFNSNFKIVFEFELKIEGETIINYQNYEMEMLINDILIEKMKAENLNEHQKYHSQIKEYFMMYFKYLVYKFIKIEAKNLIIANKKANSFIYRGFNFIINRYGNEVVFNVNYFNAIQLTFKVAKIEKKLYQPKNKEFSPRSHIEKCVTIFLSNLFFNIKVYRILKDFHGLTQNKPSLSDVIDFGFLIRNLAKISKIYLRMAMKQKFEEFFSNKQEFNCFSSISQDFFLDEFTCIFLLKQRFNLETTMRLETEFEIKIFHDGTVTVTIKQQYPNTINCIDKDNIFFQRFQRLDMNYLISIFNNILH